MSKSGTITLYPLLAYFNNLFLDQLIYNHNYNDLPVLVRSASTCGIN